jgi:hypothetical protein
MEQNGAFASSAHLFPGRGNYTYCSTMANGILLRGFFSASLNFLMVANTLLGSHPSTVGYTLQQRQQYLNDPFLTDSVKMLDYLTLVMDTAVVYLKQDLHYQTAWYTGIVVWTLLYLIIVSLISAFVFLEIFPRYLDDDLKQIRMIFCLISCKTLAEEEPLKQFLVTNLE